MRVADGQLFDIADATTSPRKRAGWPPTEGRGAGGRRGGGPCGGPRQPSPAAAPAAGSSAAPASGPAAAPPAAPAAARAAGPDRADSLRRPHPRKPRPAHATHFASAATVVDTATTRTPRLTLAAGWQKVAISARRRHRRHPRRHTVAESGGVGDAQSGIVEPLRSDRRTPPVRHRRTPPVRSSPSPAVVRRHSRPALTGSSSTAMSTRPDLPTGTSSRSGSTRFGRDRATDVQQQGRRRLPDLVAGPRSDRIRAWARRRPGYLGPRPGRRRVAADQRTGR